MREKLAKPHVLILFVVSAITLTSLAGWYYWTRPFHCGPQPNIVISDAKVIGYECRRDGWYMTVESNGMGWDVTRRSVEKVYGFSDTVAK